jgi:hypothetical protein
MFGFRFHPKKYSNFSPYQHNNFFFTKLADGGRKLPRKYWVKTFLVAVTAIQVLATTIGCFYCGKYLRLRKQISNIII